MIKLLSFIIIKEKCGGRAVQAPHNENQIAEPAGRQGAYGARHATGRQGECGSQPAAGGVLQPWPECGEGSGCIARSQACEPLPGLCGL